MVHGSKPRLAFLLVLLGTAASLAAQGTPPVTLERIMSDPVIGKIFADDEENFMDRTEFRVFTCDEVASDLKR